MFKSQLRAINFPQSEHLKLVGALAYLWGNGQFELPPLPRLSIVAGIANHDRAYGFLDHFAIGEMDDAVWLPIARRGFWMACADPVADLIPRHHILRLVAKQDTAERQALVQEMGSAIAEQIEQTGLDPELLKQVDRMTQFCDRVSYDFCQESPAEGQVEVYRRYGNAETQALRYQIQGSEIFVNPWPFEVESYQGYILGYQREGYPQRPDSLVVPYQILPGL
jgi:hypothetical protein